MSVFQDLLKGAIEPSKLKQGALRQRITAISEQSPEMGGICEALCNIGDKACEWAYVLNSPQIGIVRSIAGTVPYENRNLLSKERQTISVRKSERDV